MDIIRIENLSKSYGRIKAVDNISFKVKEGEFFSFLGLNGAGKSTTISMMCGCLSKDNGKIFIDGLDIDKNTDGIKRRLGVVFQNSVLDRPLSVRENLKIKAAMYGITGPDFQKRYDNLSELLDFGIYRYNRDYSRNYPDTLLCLYKKYTYREVCWLLNWEKEEVSLNIGGYKFDKRTKTYPIFINYEKTEDVTATTRYEDRFEDRSHLTAISKSKRTISSEDVQNAMHSKERGILLPLFVRKNKDDKTSKEFYVLGTMQFDNFAKEFIMPNTDNIHAVELRYKLNTPIEQNLYEYITEKSI